MMKGSSFHENPETLLSEVGFIRALATSLLFDEHSAEDVVQETCLAALKSPPALSSSFRGWLTTVTRNFVRRAKREKGRRLKWEKAVPGPKAPHTPSEILEQENMRRSVVEAVFRLKEPYRSAILHRFYDDLPPRKIAQLKGIPVDTVKVHIRRGLGKLREELDGKFGGRRKWHLALAPLAGFSLITTSASVASATGTLGIGGLIMGTKTKMGIAVVLVLLAAFTVMQILKDSPNTEPGKTAVAPALRERSAVLANRKKAAVLKSVQKSVPSQDLPSIELTGQVLHRKSSEPIEDAQVIVNLLPILEGVRPARGRSDFLGEFRVQVPIRDEAVKTSFHINIKAKGFRKLETSFPYSEQNQGCVCGSYYLDENRRYKIRIIDEGKNPIPGARLDFIHRHNNIFGHYGNESTFQKVANSKGWVMFAEEEILLGDWVFDDYYLHASAPGMVDTFYALKKGEDIPQEIVMGKESWWTGKVINAQTGGGIPGAKVKMKLWGFHLHGYQDRLVCESNWAGEFKVPRPKLPEKVNFAAQVWAKGYQQKDAYFGQLPEAIEMEPVAIVEGGGRAVNSRTNDPIPNLKMTINYEDEVVTDQNGNFVYTFRNLESHSLRIKADGYRSTELTVTNPLASSNQDMVVKLTPLAVDKLKIFVKDEMGQAVPGARAKIYYTQTDEKWSWSQDRLSNHDGRAIFDLFVTRADTNAKVVVQKKGFCPLSSELFALAPLTGAEKTFVLRRGILCQNIKVEDEAGAAVPGQYIVAELAFQDGNSSQIWVRSNSAGLCDISFPQFQKAKIYVCDRPDAAVDVTYRDVLEQKKITIVLSEKISPGQAVEGVVQDEAGRPLNGIPVMLYPSDMSGLESGETNSSGSFCIPAHQGKTYKLETGGTSHEGRWYEGGEIENVRAGENLTIVLRSVTRVEVLFTTLISRGISNLEYECWLEFEDGRRVSHGQTKKRDFRTTFLHVSEGKMKAVMETEKGVRYETPLFEVKEGNCISLEMEMPD